jgi:hypothetical protein
MTATSRFIEDAIKGGWTVQRSYYARPVKFLRLKHLNDQYTTIEIDDTTMVENNGVEVEEQMTTTHQTCSIFLDPLAWQAVGKTRGWKGSKLISGKPMCALWNWKCHEFIDHLAVGKSIDEALTAIE